MAIRVNSNIASLNAQRNLGINNDSLNKTLERLSSGLRINRAADDAAGLAVSEKMRTQIRGFGQAIANAQDAGNLIATAESGLDQTSQILQRIRELSIQSASDTLVNSDRKKIQVEIDQLLGELDKIAETTEFNTRPLLDGSLAQSAAREDANLAIKSNARIGTTDLTTGRGVEDMLDVNLGPGFDPSALGKDASFTFTVLAGGVDVNVTATGTTTAEHVFAGVGGGATSSNTVAAGVGEFVLEIRSTFQGLTTAGAGTQQVDMVRYVQLTQTSDTAAIAVAVNLATLFDLVSGTTTGAANEQLRFGTATTSQYNHALVVGFNLGQYADTITNLTAAASASGGVFLTAADVGKQSVVQFTSGRQEITDDKALTFHVGANEGQSLNMGVQDMRARALRVEGLNIVGANDDESRARAQNAIGVVDQALDYVNTVRSRLGAFQNRIEYRLGNLETSRENLTASESRIRDTDFAAETANLTRAQILIQAGTAVLTQANISPQSALNLL
ncbi:MAG: flagellin [Candidatus Sericytochromatia bacterium]